MAGNLEVRLLGGCTVRCGDLLVETLPQRSRRGVALMEYLILQRGQPVSAQRLIRELWRGRHIVNPENALKTMVSRLRAMLGEISPILSACVVSGQGTYGWVNQEDVSVDVLEVLDLHDALRKGKHNDPDYIAGCQRILDLYRGDLYQTEDVTNGTALVSRLHRIYLDTALGLIEALREKEAWSEILAVTQKALKIDDMDDPLRMERMRALVQLNRREDAAKEYRDISDRERRLLDTEPGEELQRFYRQMSQAGSTLRYNMDVLREKLTDKKQFPPGPFFCDMEAFREFYHIQVQNLERLGSTMFLGLIMLGDGDPAQMDSIIYKGAAAGLEEILRRNLRRGDIVCKVDEYVMALLLPTVNYQSGHMVMERIENVFYSAYSRERVPLHYRISPLGGDS